MLLIYCVKRSVRYDQGCRRLWLSVRIQSGHNHQETKCKRIFHNRVFTVGQTLVRQEPIYKWHSHIERSETSLSFSVGYPHDLIRDSSLSLRMTFTRWLLESDWSR